MRFRMVVAAGLTAGLVAAAAPAEEGYRHGRVRFVDPGVSLQRATEVSAEEALANLPFLPGDRVWTDSEGRSEFQFPDGTVVRLDSRSKLDYAGHEEGEQERIVLRLWSGSAIVRVRTRSFARFEIETPAGMVQALDRGIVRVDVEAGETRVSVYAGEASLDDGRQQVRVSSGERTYARWGGEAEEPSRFDPGEDDDFARWDGMRESEDRWAAGSSEYLPDELDAYAGEFESNGSWRYESTAGYVWIPRVEVGWQPYANGHWAWTPYGWTWVPYETWGWAPFHYGRWGFSAGWGWYWMPGRRWGPGWVSWAVGGGYVGWCPLGRHDRPVAPWGHYRGRAVPRGRHGGLDAWHVVRQPHLGVRDLGRHRIGVEQIDPAGLRVADSLLLRPTRDARGLSQDRAVPRTISRRMTPGDFVRELGADNKTTIPAPWTRGYGAPPAGVDGARHGTPRRTDRADEERPSRGWITNPGTGSAAVRRRGATTGSGRGSETATESGRGSGSAATPRQATRPAPWYTPRATDGGGDRSDRVQRREGSEGTSRSGGRAVPGGAVSRPRPGAESSRGREGSSGADRTRTYVPRGSSGRESGGAYRPSGTTGGGSSAGYQPRRSGGGESSSGYRPRGTSGGGSTGGYQPRSGGGGSGGGSQARPSAGSSGRSSGGGSQARPSGGSRGGGSGGGAQAKPSGGSSGRSSGSGHSAARPRGSRN